MFHSMFENWMWRNLLDHHVFVETHELLDFGNMLIMGGEL